MAASPTERRGLAMATHTTTITVHGGGGVAWDEGGVYTNPVLAHTRDLFRLVVGFDNELDNNNKTSKGGVQQTHRQRDGGGGGGINGGIAGSPRGLTRRGRPGAAPPSAGTISASRSRTASSPTSIALV